MNSNGALVIVLAFSAASVPRLVADEVAPRMADSPQAQKIRALTLVGGTPSSSPAELAAKKVRVIKALLDALQARVAAIDSLLRELPRDDPAATRLRAEREGILARKDEVGTMLMALASDAR
jgi:hypothetical protein